MASNSYKSPGVFINEIDKSWYETPKTRSVSVTILGPAMKGEFNTPTDVNTLAEFNELFGTPTEHAGTCASMCLGIASSVKFVRIGDGSQTSRKFTFPITKVSETEVVSAMTFTAADTGDTANGWVITITATDDNKFNIKLNKGAETDAYDSSVEGADPAGPFDLSDAAPILTAYGVTATKGTAATVLTPGTYTLANGDEGVAASVVVPGTFIESTTTNEGLVISYKTKGEIESEEWSATLDFGEATTIDLDTPFSLSIKRILSPTRTQNIYSGSNFVLNSNPSSTDVTPINNLKDDSEFSAEVANISVSTGDHLEVVTNGTFTNGTNGWMPGSGLINDTTDSDDSAIVDSIMEGLNSISDREVVYTEIVATPDLQSTLFHDKLVEIAGTRKDIVVMLDLPQLMPGSTDELLTEEKAVELVSNIKTTLTNMETGETEYIGSYAAVYYPWVKVSSSANSVPPTVAMLPAMMREYLTYPRWSAPAGEPRLDLIELTGYDKVLTQSSRNLLYSGNNTYPGMINPLCNYKNLGNTAMGQKTLLRDVDGKISALNRINVRLLINYIKVNVEMISAGYIFSNIDQITMDSWVMEVSKFLDSIKNQRGLYDYRVLMNWNTVTPEMLNNNIMPGIIQVKPTKVAEYIPIDVVILNRDDEFTE